MSASDPRRTSRRSHHPGKGPRHVCFSSAVSRNVTAVARSRSDLLEFPKKTGGTAIAIAGVTLMPTVLFVSPDADLRAVASRVLVKAGCKVEAAAHAGHASLACMEGEAFDVLVIEDQMRDVSSETITARVRRFYPDVQVVRMCDAAPGAVAEGMAVVRPFTADDLIAAIARAKYYACRGASIR
jgi:CheY-like chemotaxis protein